MPSVIDGLKEGVRYIVKIDAGVKKRGKQGLIRLNVAKEAAQKALQELFSLGYDRCIVEEMVPHETKEEAYISINLEREGALTLYSTQGGIAVEENAEDLQRFFLPRAEVLQGATQIDLPGVPLSSLLFAMHRYNMSFLEINPFILAKNKDFLPLDMAVEIDTAKAHMLPSWVAEHVITQKRTSVQEHDVQKQDEKTAAALSLRILNQNGSILTLLSGGGASLVAMDTLVTAGLQDQIINYSEYSGAPTRDETAQYVRTLFDVLFASSAPKKAVLIAGGVANFTDVYVTFQGIVDACMHYKEQLKAENIYICARRGGPNQEKGLAHLRDFLSQEGIPHDIHDPSLPLSALGERVASHI